MSEEIDSSSKRGAVGTGLTRGAWRGLGLSVVAAAIGYLAFSLWGGWHEVVEAVTRVGWTGTAVMLALSGLNYVLRFGRWQMYLRCLGTPVPDGRSAVIYLAGFALTTTPGKAGEAVRSVFLKPIGVPYAASGAAFVSERLSDLLAIVVLVCIGIGGHPAAWPLTAVGGAAAVGLVALISHPSWLRSLATGLSRRRLPLSGVMDKVFRLLIAARPCHQPRILLIASLISIAAWSAEASAFYLMLKWLGFESGFGYAAFVYALAMLAGALSFLPGGLGGTEATIVGMLILAGQSHGSAVAAAVLIRLTTLWFAVVIGVIALTTLLRQRPALAEAGRPSAETPR